MLEVDHEGEIMGGFVHVWTLMMLTVSTVHTLCMIGHSCMHRQYLHMIKATQALLVQRLNKINIA